MNAFDPIYGYRTIDAPYHCASIFFPYYSYATFLFFLTTKHTEPRGAIALRTVTSVGLVSLSLSKMDEYDEYHSDGGEEGDQLLPPSEERRRSVEEQQPQQQHHQQQQKHSSLIAGCGILSLVGAALACSLVLLGKEQYDISSVATTGERRNSTVLERLGTSLSSLRLDVESSFGRKCQALQYADLTCPTWDPDSEDGGPEVDYRVRWIDNHQNARNGNRSCQNSNYLFRPFQRDGIGFGANVYLVVQSSLYIALYSDRIFLFEPEVPFGYGGCTEQNWECYFQPLSRCKTEDAEAIVAANGGEYGEDHLNPSHKVLRASKVRRRKRCFVFFSVYPVMI